MTATTTLILGGGFGGISAANALRRLVPPEHRVVVIDRSSHFHVGAGKTWIMLGRSTREQISQSRGSLLAPGVELVEAEARGIALADRTYVLGTLEKRYRMSRPSQQRSSSRAGDAETDHADAVFGHLRITTKNLKVTKELHH